MASWCELFDNTEYIEPREYVWFGYFIFTDLHEAPEGDVIGGAGPVWVKSSTNDNNDDGYPDGLVESWWIGYKSLREALTSTGVTRKGAYGQPVTVTLYEGAKDSIRKMHPVTAHNRDELLDKYEVQ